MKSETGHNLTYWTFVLSFIFVLFTMVCVCLDNYIAKKPDYFLGSLLLPEFQLHISWNYPLKLVTQQGFTLDTPQASKQPQTSIGELKDSYLNILLYLESIKCISAVLCTT